jgi:succinate dehydrogenase/fumarate reductase flavoprotein subunit
MGTRDPLYRADERAPSCPAAALALRCKGHLRRHADAPGPVPPSHNLFREGAILVNAKGERFCDELHRPQDKVGDQPEQQAFIVFDHDVATKFNAWPHFVSTAPGVGYAYLADYERSRRDICFKAQTWKDLAHAIGVQADALMRTISHHDAQAVSRGGTAFRKPPFYALGPAKSWIVFTEGGLRVDDRLQVLGPDGMPIGGLYAAGSAGQGGLLLEGHGHHLAWAFTSGHLAGRSAASDFTRPSSHKPVEPEFLQDLGGRLWSSVLSPTRRSGL